MIQSGEHAGANDSPVVYPPPSAEEFAIEHDGIRYATLVALVSFMLTSGLWGKRPKDLADVIELIKANALDAAWSSNLIEPLRVELAKQLQASREERDIE